MLETAENKRATRAITPQDWKEIEEKLRSLFNQVKLMCDGYEITLRLERVSQFENRIRVYVNGFIKGEWFTNDCPERRFLCPRTKQFHSKKELAKWKRIDKDMYKKFAAKNTYTYYQDGWTSFRALKSHLIKNNKVIELVIDEEKSPVDPDDDE